MYFSTNGNIEVLIFTLPMYLPNMCNIGCIFLGLKMQCHSQKKLVVIIEQENGLIISNGNVPYP